MIKEIWMITLHLYEVCKGYRTDRPFVLYVTAPHDWEAVQVRDGFLLAVQYHNTYSKALIVGCERTGKISYEFVGSKNP